MNTFKVGDIVTPIRDSGSHLYSYRKGQKYKVIYVNEPGNIQTTDSTLQGGLWNGWLAKFFTLVTPVDETRNEELESLFYPGAL